MAKYAKLGNLGEIFIGLTYKPENVSPEGTIVLRSNNIQDGALVFDDVVRVNCPVRKNLIVQPNDILMCSRNGSAKLVGKCTLLSEMSEVMTFGAFMTIIRTPYNGYLRYFFDSSAFRNQIKGSATTTINQITRKMLDEIQVPIFDSETQERASKNFEKISALIALRKGQLIKLDQLVKSRFIELFGECEEHKRLEEYAFLITKGASPKWQGVDYRDEGTLFVTSENVREGYLDLSKRKYLDDKINEIQPRSMLKRNDILINIVGSSIGRAAVYDCDDVANINQAVALVRVDYSQINRLYLLTFLNSSQAIEMYGSMKKGGARDNLSLQNISDLQIPVAPIELQRQFADFVKQTQKSKLAIQQSLDKLETLKESLMQKYFG